MPPTGGERTPVTRSLPRRFRPPEVAFALIGASAATALVARVGWLSPTSLETMAGTVVYVLLMLSARWWPKMGDGRVRLGINYLCALWLYEATSRITLALGSPLCDGALLAADRRLFGETPSIGLQVCARPTLTDAMSVCYAFYHLYLHGMLIWLAFTRSSWAARHFGDFLYAGFAAGFIGYLLIPALGPGAAFPSLYGQPLTGGAATLVNTWLVGKGGALYGTFPSLHVLITAILLDHDWRLCRWRFWCALGPSLGLLASTLYLRYHYAVDLVAGFAVFAALRATVPRWSQPPP